MLPLLLAIAVAGGDAANERPEKEKRWNVARDFAAVVPVGLGSNDAGPMIGPLVRVGFEATPSIEVGVRSGYLYGLDKPLAEDRVTALSAIPIVASVRWFVLGKSVGPYLAAEGGASLLRRRYRSLGESELLALDFDAQESKWTASATAGIGWVVSRKVPIDLRGEVAAVDLVAGRAALGATAGWTIYF